MTRRPVLPALLIVVVLLLTIVILLISSSLRPDLPVIHIDEDGPKDDPPAHHLHLRRSPPLHPPPPPLPPPPPPPEVMVAEDPTAGDFHRDVDITFGDGRAKIFDHGRSLTLSMDKYSGSGFRTKNEYLFGKLDMQIKLVPGNSAGTVTTYYLSSEGSAHDEVDFEFLGNLSGDPYTLHTNVFAEGKGNREQQFHLWFDPTKDFHNYSILWNPQHIIFFVDGIPIRDFKNQESKGVPFPKNQPMRIYTSLWDAEEWATRGGKVKTDWNEAPFVAGYRNFIPDACVWSSGASSCSSSSSISSKAWFRYELDSGGQKKMRWVQKNHMVYNYCADFNRFAQEMPPECSGSS